MKKIIIAIAFITIPFGMNAQDQTINGFLTLNSNADAIMTFNNTDNSWQYFQFRNSGIRKTWMGLDNLNNFNIVKENGGNIYLGGANIGIGISTPSQKLDVNGDARITKLLLGNSASSNNPFSQLHIKGGGTQSIRIEDSSNNNLSFDFSVSENSGFSLKEATSNSTRLFIQKTTGNVGIGTTIIPSNYKLAVAGKMITEEVKVQLQTAWPDYVFSNTYNLPSLASVEKHIKDKGHLKDIPSENEVLKNGIHLGEMNAKLLQKIEELTLYTIQQEKKINTLKQQKKILDEQAEKIKKLEGQLKNILQHLKK